MLVDNAIPTANAPTIGDNPIDPASAAAPKNDAVAIPSTLPFAFHSLGVMIFGITTTATINIIAKNPNTFKIVIVTSVMSILSTPPSEPAIDVTTDNTAIAKISSITAAPMISLASGVLILPNSLNTWIEIAILVAVSAVAINIDCNASNPNIWNTANPAKNGITTPNVPTVNDAFPPLRNSFGVISKPAINKITIAPISPSILISLLMWSNCFPSTTKNAPNANGPTIIPANNSPKTIGSFNLRKSSAINLAANRRIPTPIIVSMNSASAKTLLLLNLGNPSYKVILGLKLFCCC